MGSPPISFRNAPAQQRATNSCYEEDTIELSELLGI